MKETLISAIFLILGLFPAYSAESRKSLINDGWSFCLTDSTNNNTTVETLSALQWETVTLPHDWSIRLPFDREAAPGNDGGYLPAGTAWYKTMLDLPSVASDRVYKLYFEGVYERSEVYVNGKLAGGRPYGYSSFFVDITPYVKKGKNDIAVRVDNSKQKNSRWYTGSGIYRNVWLVETSDVRIADWGIGIRTPDLNTAEIAVTVENTSKSPKAIVVAAEVDGIFSERKVNLVSGAESTVDFRLDVPGAKPWSTDTPNLYTATITLKVDGKIIDTVDTDFGFRTISYSAVDGFRLNGEQMLLNGACIHHDNGILGAAAFDRAERRKAEMMKEGGFNAVRTSHNPPSEAFLAACDEIGLLVIDEALDAWRDPKNSNDYHTLFDEWAAKDVGDLVRRDRNHPSIFCWSIGNEIIERKSPKAVEDAGMLAGVCKSIDPTRPVTQALASWDSDWEIYDPLAAEHDIVGYNYMIHKAEGDHERVPERVMMQTESYPRDAWANYRMAMDHPYVIGDFVWTGLDYIGESGIGRWYYEGEVPGEHYERPLYPWHAAYCGDIDLIGLRKPISHYRSMLWNEDGEKLYMAVREPDGYKGSIKTTLWGTWPTFESWNWPGHEGQPIDVEVYSRYPEVRLSLNGKVLEHKATEKMMATFTVDYVPGTLLAEGISDGKVMESRVLATAGPVSDVRVTADRDNIKSDGQDLSFVLIECVDAEGRVVPVADQVLTVTVEGPVELMALGNADIKDKNPYYDNTHKAWKGHAMAVLRSNGGKGQAKVSVSSVVDGGKIGRAITISCE